MRIYVRVVERGSMSAAARDIGIGQPAVSERIERLEAHLGTRLLRRNTRRMSLTDSGALFYERSKVAISAADLALAVVDERAELKGLIRIAAPYGAGEEVLMPALLRLRANHPDLNIELVLNDRVVDPVTEGVDISFRLGDPGEGNFVAHPLGEVRRMLVASPEYLARNGTPASPDDLIHHAFARVSGLFNDSRLPLISQHNQIVSARLNVVFSANHWRPLYSMLRVGESIGVLQYPVCHHALKNGLLVALLPDYTVPSFSAYLLYPPINKASREVSACVIFLKRALAETLQEVVV
ncbi:LysR family transcriptional regulator [Cedecea neteri]|uniref:LysR family transcriptional regulator n=1 Tax=Cedecea neteri TaxID=158822 RepID=UPI0028978854|nr:LysR family transcriptional regulator [Cedecea neteri]